jgi:predicted NAD-dependent protein-ADP-ribosyltransferase YbiA (DUF1768 family)
MSELRESVRSVEQLRALVDAGGLDLLGFALMEVRSRLAEERA